MIRLRPIVPGGYLPSWRVAFLAGVVCAVLPEIGVGAALLYGTVRLTKGRSRLDWLTVLLSAFALVRGVQATRATGDPIPGVLAGLVPLLIYHAASARILRQPALTRGLAAGLALLTFLATAQVVAIAHGGKPIWRSGSGVENVRMLNREGGFVAAPAGAKDAWITSVIGPVGPGRVRLQLDLRSSRSLTLNISIANPSLSGGRRDTTCFIGVNPGMCVVEADLPTRDVVVAIVGGYGTWRGFGPTVEVIEARVQQLDAPSLGDILRSIPRAQLWTYSPNALGAWITLLTLFIVAAPSLSRQLIACVVFTGLLGVFLTGSRSALLALALGLVIVAVRSKRAAAVAVFVATILLVMVSNLGPQSALRSLRFGLDEASRERVIIYEAIIGFVPRHLAFGVGNLCPAVTSELREAGKMPIAWVCTHAHSLVLQILGESGVVGVAALIAVLGLAAWRVAASRDFGIFAILGAFLALNLADVFLDFAPVVLFVWLAIGMCLPLHAVTGPRSSVPGARG